MHACFETRRRGCAFCDFKEKSGDPFFQNFTIKSVFRIKKLDMGGGVGVIILAKIAFFYGYLSRKNLSKCANGGGKMPMLIEENLFFRNVFCPPL